MVDEEAWAQALPWVKSLTKRGIGQLWVHHTGHDESKGYGTAPSRDGKFLLVTMPNTTKVAVVDLASLKVVRTVDVPNDPEEVLVRPDGKFAYVSCVASHQVAEVDLATWKVSRLIKTGKLTDGLAWAAGK